MAERVSPHWDPPEPADRAFVEHVRACVALANHEARVLAGVSVAGKARKKTRRMPGGGCKGCGIAKDEMTPGCPNCRARHEMRLRSPIEATRLTSKLAA